MPRWRRAAALRAQTARRDPAALAALYERHHQALYRYCRSLLHHDEDARDALQSTMTKALAALQDEHRDFEVRPWLFRIAHNEAISRLRQRREAVDLDAVGTLASDSLAQTVEDRERLALLQADLRDLPERQRSALVLRELGGLSHAEIAIVIDCPARAVKQAIFEARAALHECAEGRTMLCVDVQRALSDGDGRVLRGRRVRAHVRSCRSCRAFKTALAQRPADLAALAPGLPATAGAALLAHLLPGAKAGLASSATAATGAGGGMAATVGTKVALVALATATVAGTGSLVRDAVPPPHRSAVSAAAAPSAASTRPISARAAAPASLRPVGRAPIAASARSQREHSHAASDPDSSSPSRGAPAHPGSPSGVPPARAKGQQHGTKGQQHGARGQATAQAKRHAAGSHRPASAPERATRHPAHPAKATRPGAAAIAHPAHPEHPPAAATHASGVPHTAAPAPPPSAGTAPADAPAATALPGNSGAAHAAK
ncbi:MAG TPA: RNA polymerase sigma factor [Solirubrobacteraceae bacterium]